MNVFDGLINRFTKAKEKNHELEYRSAETSQIAKQTENEMKKIIIKIKASKDFGTIPKSVTYA